MSKLLMVFALVLTTGAVSAQAEVLINEVDADTYSIDVLEFVELYGDAGAPLDGLVMVFYNGYIDASYSAFDLDGYSLDANGFFLLGNAGVVPTPSIIFPSNGLQNGADAVALYAGDAADFPTATAVTTVNLLDAVVYDTNEPDDAGLLALLLPGEAQLDEGGSGDKDMHSNMRCPDGEGGARSTSDFYQFAASPGVSNDHACEPIGNDDMSWGGLKSQYK